MDRSELVIPSTAENVSRAAERLRAGQLVAFPTETVYGLGARADWESAVAKIYAAKGRPSTNPLIVHVASINAARDLAADWPTVAEQLARAFWPGPLTLVLAAAAGIASIARAGLPTLAVRVPAHASTHALLTLAGVPVAAPSANRSGHISPTCAEHVWRSLGPAAGMILDAGPCPVGVESTIVDVTTSPPRLLRPGGLPLALIKEVASDLVITRWHVDQHPTSAQPAPGMSRRHYAPAARVVIYAKSERATLADEIRRAGRQIGVIWAFEPPPAGGTAVRLPDSPQGYATQLFAALHELEQDRCELIAIEAVPDDLAWLAVADRLERAAT